jgi:hypothetical protein
MGGCRSQVSATLDGTQIYDCTTLIKQLEPLVLNHAIIIYFTNKIEPHSIHSNLSYTST